MYPFKRILIATDFSFCAEAAWHHALYLAGRYEATVFLLYVAVRPHGHPRPSSGGSAEQDGRWPDPFTESRPARSAYTEHGRDVRLTREIVHHPEPAAAILDYAQAHDVDLIVLGAHGDRGAGHFLSVGRTLLGQTAEQVVRHAPCPVFRVGLRNGRSPELIGRILVPVDLSVLSLLGLAYARDLASFYDARLDVLRVLEEPPDFPAGDETEKEEPSPEEKARLELIEAFEQTRGPAVSAAFHVVRGRPDREICGFVKRHAVDLIVLGAHSDVGRDVLGIVAEKVIRTAPCPVLAVRDAENDPDHPGRHTGASPESSVFP